MERMRSKRIDPILIRLSWVLPLALLLACAGAPSQRAERLYFGGPILTMAGAEPAYAEALAIAEGRILAVGAREQVEALADAGTERIDLAGRALLPGFIDAHSHIATYEMTWGLPVLSPPPVGKVERIADIQRLLSEFLAASGLAPGELVIGSGYDDSLLAERRHPNRHDLDAVSREHPILISHASGHILVANTRALELVGFGRETPAPPGGVIRREADGHPDGVVEELAALPFLRLIEPDPLEKQIQDFEAIQLYYASLGITTAQDGISMAKDIELLKATAAQGRLILDVVSYPRWDLFNDVLAGERKLEIEYHPPMHACNPALERHAHPEPEIRDAARTQVGIYVNRLKFGGVKISADGSPQGKTAYLTKPYLRPPEGLPGRYRGYPTVSQEELDRWFDVAYGHDVQLLVHCNGDAAADMLIAAVRQARAEHGPKDLRPVMIHAQMIRKDQVDAMAELGIVPSFFTAHTFYWGDWHVSETVGPERAAWMSPTGYAATLGLRFTNHTDAPVVPPDHFDLIWTAVHRQTRSGVVIGPEQRIPIYRALRAVTLDAAYQYFEEHEKGSLEPGKRADLIVIDRDPLAIDPGELRSLRVLETIKDGQTIWRRTE